MIKILKTGIFCCSLLAVSLLMSGCATEEPLTAKLSDKPKTASWPSEPDSVTESKTYPYSFAYFYECIYQANTEGLKIIKTGNGSARISFRNKELSHSSATRSIYVPAESEHGFEISDGKGIVYRGRSKAGGAALTGYVAYAEFTCSHRYDIDINIEESGSNKTTVSVKSTYLGVKYERPSVPYYTNFDGALLGYITVTDQEFEMATNSSAWKRYLELSKECDYAEYIPSLFKSLEKLLP